MAALDDAGKRDYVSKNAAADLQYVLEDSSVLLDLQYRLVRHDTSLKIFAAMGGTAADIRNAAQTDFAIDPAAFAENRANVAKLVSAWNLARDLAAKEKELFAESKILGAPRILQHSERQAMIKVENAYGRLQDSEIPANEYLAIKLEEVENGEPIASSLDEIMSKQEKNTSSLQTSLDVAGHLRVTKIKGKGKMPESTEDYRRLLKIEGVTWLCMAAKFKSKSWLQDLQMSDFNKFVEYVLGDRVNGIKTTINGSTQPLRPAWGIVLEYEFKLRKEAFKLVVRGQMTLKEALEAVVKDSELKESYFVTPLTLSTHETPSKFQKTSGKGNHGQDFHQNANLLARANQARARVSARARTSLVSKVSPLFRRRQTAEISVMHTMPKVVQGSVDACIVAESSDALVNTVDIARSSADDLSGDGMREQFFGGFHEGPLLPSCGHKFHVLKLIGKTDQWCLEYLPVSGLSIKDVQIFGFTAAVRFVGGPASLDRQPETAVSDVSDSDSDCPAQETVDEADQDDAPPQQRLNQSGPGDAAAVVECSRLSKEACFAVSADIQAP
eukprot:s303_g26.t1